MMCKLVARLQIRFPKYVTNCYHGVRYLHENGTDIHADEELSLRVAAFSNNHVMIKYLIDNGANIDIAMDNAMKTCTVDVLEKYKNVQISCACCLEI